LKDIGFSPDPGLVQFKRMRTGTTGPPCGNTREPEEREKPRKEFSAPV